MPTIYDNQNTTLISGLKDALDRSYKSDICTAYFNLRGWKKIASAIQKYNPTKGQCRLLLGMYNPDQQLKKELLEEESTIDRSTAQKLKAQVLSKLKKQLTLGIPSNEDEKGLKQLIEQIKEKKVIIKCFTRYPLHAKLYLTFNKTEFAQNIGFMGSSNLTLAGLEKNGELNIDVLDQQACQILGQWFEDKWNDQYALDLSQDIIKLIDDSWAKQPPYPPYYVYIKMAYHLSEDARKGLTDFFIPKALQNILFDFQAAAVRIATHYVYHKNGVLIGDVVGLGKTLMAIAVAKILEEENGWQTLVLCPKHLEKMWKDHISHEKWGLRGQVIPISQVQSKLPDLQRHHVVIIDESHNLRNANGKRYKIIKDYIFKNDSKCILLSATPYNKTYLDLSSQLGLFIDRDADLGIRPSQFLSQDGQMFEGLASSLKAFEKSTHPEDWQQLMSQFLVRRTRSFIKQNYGQQDKTGRCYIQDQKGSKKFFPNRIAKTVKYQVDEQYQKLFSKEVVQMIGQLHLSRYNLNRYKKSDLEDLTDKEKEIFKDLEQARSHPKGFCRIGLFKRLESSGFAFLKSIQRHILRNCIFIYAIDNQKDLMIKEGNSDILSDAFDEEEGGITGFLEDGNEESYFCTNIDQYYQKAQEKYSQYKEKASIKWLSSTYFTKDLLNDLKTDTEALINLLKNSKEWQPEKDLKLKELEGLLQTNQKALVFSQSRETAEYLKRQLTQRGFDKIGLVTGGMDNIQKIIQRFSPKSNKAKVSQQEEIDVLIATDVLSEGQNLQDCHTVINYDLPWAIIKLVQRVGRIDRIGQLSDHILCYSFMPNEGLEELIRLKARIKNRLKENAEVIGTDEQFFQEERQILIDLYNEKSEVLERDILEDIDLSSYALEIWKKAIKKDPLLEEQIKNMPDSVHSSKQIAANENRVLLFAKSYVANNILELNEQGHILSENQKDILDKAKCQPDTPAQKRMSQHYEIIRCGLKSITQRLHSVSMAGRLGTGRHPRKKLFELFEKHVRQTNHPLDEQIMDDLFKHPLLSSVEQPLARMFRRKRPTQDILSYVREKHQTESLLNKKEAQNITEQPRIICSMGLKK